MGGLSAARKRLPREAGDLLALEAIDRTGVAVTREGALVRAIHVTPPNPLIMADEDRRRTAEGFGYLVGRLRAGQSLQFYVEARPIDLDALLARTRAQVALAAGKPPEPSTGTGADRSSAALWRLYGALEESLRIHADDQAAVALDSYVLVPYLPAQRSLGFSRAQLRNLRAGGGTAPLERRVSAHRRALRESLQHTDTLRAELEALDLPTRLLDGEQIARLLWGRFNPTLADRGQPLTSNGAVETLGELDTARDTREARMAAKRLRELVCQSALDFKGSHRHAQVDRDLEQTIYAAGTAEATPFGWLLGAMQTRQPYALSVHVHALDRMHERNRHKMSYRRVFAVNRASEQRGQVPDFDRYRQEEEHERLLSEMSGGERTSLYRLSLYMAIREPGPKPAPDELALAVDYVCEQIAAASDIRMNRGEWQQRELWESTLPLGRDIARRTRKYATRNVARTLPLVGTGCGSPAGIPLGFAEPGRTIELLDPYDRSHDNFTLLINGRSGSGKTLAANVILARCLAHGARCFVLDRAGHYEVLTRLVPDARHIAIGADESEWAINPWDVPDPGAVSLEKIAFLTSLHTLLVGNSGGRDAQATLERNMLEGAIRAVYRRAGEERFAPLERHLREELRARTQLEAESGAQEVASILRSLSERLESFCGEGAYAYLLDRETNVPADAPLLVFDTRRVPDAVLRPVIFTVTEHVTRAVEARRKTALHATDGGREQMFAGRSILLIDEGWHVVQNAELGEYANDLARRARHLGLFLIVISQQLSDFDNEHGRALIRNSTMQLFLRQVAEELDYVQDALRLTDEEAAIIARLKTVKGSHSQAYFINGVRGRGALSIRVGPTEYWLATSDPTRDVPARERVIERQGGDVWAAIAELATGEEEAGRGEGTAERAR